MFSAKHERQFFDSRGSTAEHCPQAANLPTPADVSDDTTLVQLRNPKRKKDRETETKHTTTKFNVGGGGGGVRGGGGGGGGVVVVVAWWWCMKWV